MQQRSYRRWIALLTGVGILASTLLTGCDSLGPSNRIQLSEVMAKNNGTLADNDGEYPDWIEIHNASDQAVSLKNYGLTDDVQEKSKFRFPEMTIEAGEYLVVYASGKNYVDAENKIVHLPFSINAQEEDVYLYDPNAKELGHVAIRNIPENTSCGMNEEGETVYFQTPTPGAANSASYVPSISDQPGGTADLPLQISEYATKDSITLADEDGEFVSWVEVHNTSDQEISLQGVCLTDDPSDSRKWSFPAISLAPNGYLVVYLSGKSKNYQTDANLHASFVLSGKESELALFTADGKKIDSCAVKDLTSNLSYGRSSEDPNTWLFYAKPTPGKANTSTGFAEIESARYPKNKSTVISEAAAVNTTGVKASDGQTYDFIELHNPTDKPVSLKGCRLSTKQDPAQYKSLPDIQIPAGGYQVIYCGDVDKYNSRTNEIFMDMGVNRYGEHIYLLDADGLVIDDLQTGRLEDQVSSGRISDTDPLVYYLDSQTPGKANPTSGKQGVTPTPVFSVSSGYVDNGTQVEISCPGATIRYTTDGSTPTASSPVYTAPITISKTVTIRAKAFMDGRRSSDDRAGSYMVGRRHDLPVIFLSTDPANLFDYQTGILADGPGYTATFPHVGANYWKDWERPVHFEYIDENGQAQLEFNAGIKVFGQYSRASDQKSFSINLRDKYGPKEFCYPLFGEDSPTNVFSELVLRNSGQDNVNARMRDAFVAQSIAGQMDIDYMQYQPVVVYLNGEYYGLYDLRDKICEAYVANRTGADEDQIDMIKGNNIVMSGSTDEYRALLNYVKTHDLSNAENYAYVASRVDIEEWINYWITITFFGNTDTGNIKFYRERKEGAKWRWVVFDQDWALWSGETGTWNMVEEFINPNGHGVGHMFSSDLARALMKNSAVRDQFIQTYGKYLKTTFSPDRLLSLFDQMVAEIETEMPYHIEKWGTPSTVESWQRNCRTLRGIIEKRAEKTRKDIIATFSCQSSSYASPFKLSAEQVEKLLDSGT